jgi:hypothetical protein
LHGCGGAGQRGSTALFIFLDRVAICDSFGGLFGSFLFLFGAFLGFDVVGCLKSELQFVEGEVPE